mgnify:CR=1 FL=1
MDGAASTAAGVFDQFDASFTTGVFDADVGIAEQPRADHDGQREPTAIDVGALLIEDLLLLRRPAREDQLRVFGTEVRQVVVFQQMNPVGRLQ